jgi:hypothetical protein
MEASLLQPEKHDPEICERFFGIVNSVIAVQENTCDANVGELIFLSNIIEVHLVQ